MHQHGGDIYNHTHVTDFSSNINFLGAPKKVLEAAQAGVLASHTYPDWQCRELKEAIGTLENVPPAYITCGNGAADVIFSLVHALAPKEAMVLSPTFYEYEQALQSVSCNITYHELTSSSDFLLGEDLLSKLTSQLDLLFLCNPNNPTGQLISGELLEAILHRCWIHDILLVVDECFLDFVPDCQSRSMKPYLKDHPNLFLLKAFTKLYAIPGLRLGYGLCSNLSLLERMKECSQPWNVSLPAQMAGIAATKEHAYVAESLRQLALEKTYLLGELKKLPLHIFGHAANYIFFSTNDTKDIEHDTTFFRKDIEHDSAFFRTEASQDTSLSSLYEDCLSQGILIRDCSNYRGLSFGYYRIAIKGHSDNMALIAALKEVL